MLLPLNYRVENVIFIKNYSYVIKWVPLPYVIMSLYQFFIFLLALYDF